MYAWQCKEPTGVSSLAWVELPTPQPAADEVVVEIRAASLNFPDLLMVQNKYQIKPPPPFIPGAEFAGHVVAVRRRCQTTHHRPSRRLFAWGRRIRNAYQCESGPLRAAASVISLA